MADAADDRDLVAKSVRPVGPQAIPSRSGEAMRRLADLTYPLKPDGESRCLSVSRGISLSGEVNSCDKLLIEGSVDAKLTNCRANCSGRASRTAWDHAVPTGMAVKFARLSAGGEWIRTFSSAMRLRRRQRGGGVTPSDPDVWPWARSLLFDFAP